MTSIITKLVINNFQRLVITNNLMCIRCSSSMLRKSVALAAGNSPTLLSNRVPSTYTQIRLKFDKKKRKQTNEQEEVRYPNPKFF